MVLILVIWWTDLEPVRVVAVMDKETHDHELRLQVGGITHPYSAHCQQWDLNQLQHDSRRSALRLYATTLQLFLTQST